MMSVRAMRHVVMRVGVGLCAVAAASASIACNSMPPGTRRVLGPTTYDNAFSTAREVMGRYFPIAESDRKKGVIKSRPRLVEAARFRVSSPVSARQTATLRLRRDGRYVVAFLAVAIYRQGGRFHRMEGPGEENYRARPGRTPAELEGATTYEQNQAWQFLRHDHVLQRTILDELASQLRAPGSAQTMPAEP